MELSQPEPTRYHKVRDDAAAIGTLFVEVFLEALRRPAAQVILDLDATDDPLHRNHEVWFFLSAALDSCGCHLPAARRRWSNIGASAGADEEIARIVAQNPLLLAEDAYPAAR